MIWLLILVAIGLFVVERLWPAMELSKVSNWWGRIVFLNAIQLGVIILSGYTWDRWLARTSLFHISDHFNDIFAALIAYFISTFIYYWWHRFRHESRFFWLLCHQLHHSPRRIELLTSFYKHPVEILINSILSSLIIYSLLGCSITAGAYYIFLTALAEYFYHWNIKTPHWLGNIVQRPESHRVHHQYRNHTNNFADLPIWDMLFGTFKNPKTFEGQCGYDDWREDRFEELLIFRDVHKQDIEKLSPLHFLPTCIGCSKRWACSESRLEAVKNRNGRNERI